MSTYTLDTNVFSYGLRDPTPQPHPFPRTFASAYSYTHETRPTNQNASAETELKDYTPHSNLLQYINIKNHPNGGASIVHMDQNDFSHLSSEERSVLADLFLKEVFKEEPVASPVHVMGVVHNAANFLPELVDHFGTKHPDVTVKMGNLRNSEIETTSFSEYYEKVRSSYSNGTFRCGPLLQVSLVGQVSEEAGRYFPEFLGEFLKYNLIYYMHYYMLVFEYLNEVMLLIWAVPFMSRDIFIAMHIILILYYISVKGTFPMLFMFYLCLFCDQIYLKRIPSSSVPSPGGPSPSSTSLTVARAMMVQYCGSVLESS